MLAMLAISNPTYVAAVSRFVLLYIRYGLRTSTGKYKMNEEW